MKKYLVLLKNEGKLSIRDMNMILFAIGMPVVVLIIYGIIYGSKPAATGYTFLELSFGAICAISMCAGGLMGLPVVIADYREKKILKRFQVTPISPLFLLMVELSIYMLYCICSLLLCWMVGAIFWKIEFHGNIGAFLGSWFLTMVSTLSIGMLVGGIAKNTKQAGVIASILYFPVLIFSGITVPIEVLPRAVQSLAKIVPFSMGVNLMKENFLGIAVENHLLAVLAMCLLTALCTGLAVKLFKWE